MSAVLSENNVEVLPPRTPVAQAVSGPNMTVIDADTGNITYQRKGASLLLAEAVAVHTEAKDLAELIDSDSMYTEAGALLTKITDSFKSLDEERLLSTKPLRDKVDEINADYKPAIEKRKEAAQLLKNGMLAYDAEVERKRRQAEAEARARAEEERKRVEAESRAARERAEADAAAARKEAEARAAEERRVAEANAQRMLEEAKGLDDAGNFARAAQLRSEANAILGIAEEAAQTALFEGEQVAAAAEASAAAEAEAAQAAAKMITPAAPTFSAPRAAGVSKRKVYAAKVVDAKALLQFVLANWDTMNHYVTIEQSKLNTLAQNQKERFNLPGCELQESEALASRRR